MQTGGTNTMSNSLYIGSGGTYNLSGCGLLSASSLYIGHYETGTFTQNGGTNNISGNLYLGDNYYSIGNGTYNLGGAGLFRSPVLSIWAMMA